MFFLMEYDRQNARTERMRQFRQCERHAVEKLRLETELEYARRGLQREVVILEAENETALRRTHQRYFENLDQMLLSAREQLASKAAAAI